MQVIAWEDFTELFKRNHEQGEHVALVGQTGSGKSVLAFSLCEIIGSRPAKNRRPSSVVILGTKPRDDTLMTLARRKRDKWPIIKTWPPAYGQEHCIVWPRGGTPTAETAKQRRVFGPLLGAIYQEGGQAVCIDEASEFERNAPQGLGLAPTMEKYWTAARSNKLTLIAGTQRPRHVTLYMWTEPSWVFIFSLDDELDIKRVAELSGAKQEVLEILPQLGPYECLCIRRQRGVHGKQLYVTKVGT